MSLASRALMDFHFLLYDLYQKLFRSKRVRAFLCRVIPDLEDTRILDAGCGTGYLSTIFEKAKVVGFDSSWEKVEFCKRKRRGEFHNLAMRDVHRIPGTFDFCTCITVFHHVGEEELGEFLEILETKLEDGGSLVVVETVMEKGNAPVETLMRYLDKGDFHRSPEQILSLVSRNWRIKEFSINEFWCYRYVFIEAKKHRGEGRWR